ncbi:hypothetical protein C2857_006989 [Epichloe festucae Fl1]|uniref:Uncharacterized protein n=1 Tax=Epichloe festucae (strain Fl1) TaxID=877507 RepID=A0A7S9KU59_EPIFF|nr:hypothetical protein C2857_006989 [Epichloe festucae Fl1]
MASTMLLRSSDTQQHVDSEADAEKSYGPVTKSETGIHVGDREAKRACLNGSLRRPRLRPGGPETGSISALLRGHEMRQVYVKPIVWSETQLQILDIEFRETLTKSEQTAAEQDERPKESTEGGTEQQSEPGWTTKDWLDGLYDLRTFYSPEIHRSAVQEMLAKLDIVESPIDEIKWRRVHDNKLRPDQIAFRFGGKRVGRLATGDVYDSKSGIPCLAYLNFWTISQLRMQHLTRKSNKVRPFRLKNEHEDPYIASVLIGLAQEQLSRGGSTSEAKEQVVHVLGIPGVLARHIYFYKAVIPREFLRKLESPSEAVECGKLTVRYLEFSLRDLPTAAECLWRVLKDHCAS